MDTHPFPLKPERLAELTEFFAWKKQDYNEALEGVRRGYEDMKAGRVQDADEFFEDLRVEHGFPR